MAAIKGQARPEEVKKRISETMKGKKKTAEHRARISQVRAKNPLPMEYLIDVIEKEKDKKKIKLYVG